MSKSRGRALRHMRLKAGYKTTYDMALAMVRYKKRIGKDGWPSAASLSRYERGETIPFEKALKIARFLGCSFPWPPVFNSPEEAALPFRVRQGLASGRLVNIEGIALKPGVKAGSTKSRSTNPRMGARSTISPHSTLDTPRGNIDQSEAENANEPA